MNKKFTFLTAALALLAFLAIPMGMWGQTTETVTLSNGTFSTDHITWTCASNGITIQQLKGTSSNAVNSSYISAPRVYKGHVLSFVGSETIKIKQIDITVNGTYYGNSMTAGTAYSNNTVTDNTEDVARTWTTTSGGTHVVSSVSTEGLSAIYIQNVASATNTQLRPSAISITYIVSGDTPTTYTVTYDANGGTGIMTDSNSPYNSGATVTVLANTFTRDNYTFSKWNTAANGSGTDYDADDTFTINANTTLYAQWTENGGGTDEPAVILDFTSNTCWNFPTTKTLDENSYTCGDYTIILKGAGSGNGYYYYASGNSLLNGKSGAYLQLPASTFDVEKIVVEGASGASSSVKQNIFVGTTAVSTETTGATTTNTYNIDDNYQAAGNVYTLKVTSSHNTQITKIKIYAKDTNIPAISASNLEIAYNATNGNIAYTINNEPTSAGTLTAAVSSGTISNLSLGTPSNGTIAFTCDANTEGTARTATVTLIYTYGNNETVTKTVTITQAAVPMAYTTIPALFAAATSDETPVFVTFNNWVVSGVSTNGKSVFVTDNNGNGFVIYYNSDMSSTYAAGDILSGTAVSCTLKKYNGFAELLNVDATDLTITTGGTVSTANIAMASLAGVNTGALVHYDNLTCSVTDGKYYLSDGTTTLQVYNSLFAFDALEDGETYNITGIYQQYNSTKEILPRSAADIVKVEVQHEAYTLTVSTLNEHINGIYVFDAADQNTQLIANGQAGTAQVLDGTEVMVSVDIEAGYIIESLIVDGNNVTSQIEADAYTFTMPTHAVTITATAVESVTPPTPGDGNYVRITSLDQLTNGSIVVIAARYNENATNYYAMKNTLSNGKTEGEEFISTTSNGIEVLPATIVNDIDNYYWTVTVNNGDYTFTKANGDVIGWGSSTNFVMNGNNTAWSVIRGTSPQALVEYYDGFVITNVNSTNTNTTRCFAFKGDTEVFGPYAWSNNTNDKYNFYLDFFVQTSTPVTEPITLDIAAWTTDQNGVPGNWYLITSPLAEPTAPSAVINMIPENLSNVDLYRFDQNPENGLEWINYKKKENGNVVVNNDFGNLIAGQGYLYANASDVQLQFTGTPYSGNNCQVNLDYSTQNGDSNMHGWNLVGNPFTVEATIGDWDYMRMNSDHNEIILYDPVEPVNIAVAPMEGIFVHATEEGQSVTFTPSETKATRLVERTIINLTLNDNVVDRAIIRYGSGSPMPKIQLNEENTKIYFAMEDGAYAVVVCDNQNELLLNFMAATSGTYTLSFINQNAEFSYLHLIDNKTNTETDLLVNPNYTFSAQTTDDEARFIVVYERAYIGKDIIGYGESEDRDHYYLIASPIGEVDPDRVGDIFTYEHDLYYFDQDASDGLEWINIKDGNTNLMPGTGYLYASEQDVTLKFYGSAYSGEGEVTLAKDATNNPEGGFEGWNLVGNPFAQTAYIDRDFYVMREDGAEIILSERDSIGAMEGVFVNAVEDGEVMTFGTSPIQDKGQVVLNVTKGRGITVDRAFVRFGEGRQLPKFQLFKNNTKLYIPVDGQDYAVVRGEEIGEMPVSFKAESNDIYTLNLSKDNVEFAYLHLIDNMTGNDVDLLQTPSYSFEAKTTDYANRFKLVFATGNSSSDTFAFFSNGSFVINNEGNATLQVIDVTGRIIKSESINGCANVNVNATTGVYMLRLVNGDNVKVQKVVVR